MLRERFHKCFLPPELKGVWDAAVDFIDKKESRVRGEIQPVNGEDYKVWRWLPTKHNVSLTSSTAESPPASPQSRLVLQILSDIKLQTELICVGF